MARVVRYHKVGGPEVLLIENVEVPPPSSKADPDLYNLGMPREDRVLFVAALPNSRSRKPARAARTQGIRIWRHGHRRNKIGAVAASNRPAGSGADAHHRIDKINCLQQHLGKMDMPANKRRYSAEEFARRGDALVETKVRPNLTVADADKFVAIDIETGEYELDANEMKAVSRLRRRVTDSQIWLVHATLGYLHRFGGHGLRGHR